MMARAGKASLADACRAGCLIELPRDGELMVTGDVHGHLENFERIVEIAALDAHPDRHLILQEFVHSLALTPGGRDLSCVVLERQAELKLQYPDRVHVLLGNHELSEFQGRKVYKDGRMLNSLFRRGVVSQYGDDAPAVIQAYRRYFRNLPLAALTRTKILLCHSTPERRYVHRYDAGFFRRPPNLYDVVQKTLVEELVWGRDFDADVADAFADRVGCELMIVGHTPCDDGYLVPSHRHVVIDCKDERAAYLLLKLNQPYSQKGVVNKISPLWPSGREPPCRTDAST